MNLLLSSPLLNMKIRAKGHQQQRNTNVINETLQYETISFLFPNPFLFKTQIISESIKHDKHLRKWWPMMNQAIKIIMVGISSPTAEAHQIKSSWKGISKQFLCNLTLSLTFSYGMLQIFPLPSFFPVLGSDTHIGIQGTKDRTQQVKIPSQIQSTLD